MRVLIVDDDSLHVDLTTYALRRQGIQVFAASTGTQALKACEQERPDLVLLDVSLPSVNGFEVCRRIRERSATPIIMLTSHAGEDDVLQGFQAGADDYVTKPFSARQLMARIEAVLRRSRVSSLERSLGQVEVGSLLLDVDRHEVTKDGESVLLTPLEFRILHLLAMNAGRVIPYNRLLEYAWGYEADDPGLLRSHLYHIRAKLNLPKRGPGSIRSVSGVGYSLSAER
jgi:DNA-binding response OmpR family regulator